MRDYKDIFDKVMNSLNDFKIEKSYFFSKGREKGKTEGRMLAIKQIAIRLIAQGDSNEKIAFTTGLSIEQIRTLKK